MKKPAHRYAPLFAALAVSFTTAALSGQIIRDTIIKTGEKPALAVPDFRGSGAAQPLMAAFNKTLSADLEGSGLFEMKSKSFFPANNPQRPEDLRPEDAGAGYALKDWSGSPVSASHLVFGYTAAVNGVFVLYGNVYDTRQADPQGAKLFAQTYPDSPDEAGATRAAHKFASDIIQRFGGSGGLLNSRIYFISNRGGSGKFGTQLWVMDWDGKNEKQLTFLKGIVAYPAISPDGSKLAFTIWPDTGDPRPRIGMVTSESGRTIPFYNQAASLNATANFSPDGAKIFYSSSASGSAQIYSANGDGSGFTRITSTRGNPSEPKVNPKNPGALLFVDGAPNEQIYKMNSEGAGIERVTNGEGEASNPAWSPDGQNIAFAWTRGYQQGAFNIFIMNVGAPQTYTQLTHDGKNENPVWAPDGIHIVFTRTTRSGAQIYTMRADGKDVKQLTTQGNNRYPVWGVK